MGRARPEEDTLQGIRAADAGRAGPPERSSGSSKGQLVSEFVSRRHPGRIREGRYLPPDAFDPDRAARIRSLHPGAPQRRAGQRVRRRLRPEAGEVDLPAQRNEVPLRVLPIGGFCAMQGEDDRSPRPSSSASIASRARSGQQLPGQAAVATAGDHPGGAGRELSALLSHLADRERSRSASPAIRPSRSSARCCPDRRRRRRDCAGDRIVAIDDVAVHDGRTWSIRSIRRPASGSPRLRAPRHAHRGRFVRDRARAQVGKNLGIIGFPPAPAYQRVGVDASDTRERQRVLRDSESESRRLRQPARDASAKYAPQVAGRSGWGRSRRRCRIWAGGRTCRWRR